MNVDLTIARSSLARTPSLLRAYFDGLDDAWNIGNEGPGTWSPLETLTHMVHVEPTWIDRIDHIRNHRDAKVLPLVDRRDHMEAVGVRSAEWLLTRFERLRREGLDRLDETTPRLAQPGLHAELGAVTLGQLLAAWTVHDLNHVGQIVKTMAKQYREAVGPWRRFLAVVDAP